MIPFAGPLVNDPQRPRCRDAAPCQDRLKAFLAEWGISGLLYHTQLAKHLARAGFDVRHVERKDYHDVWILRLRRGHVPTGHEIEWLKQQVRLFLKRYGLRYPKREIDVMVQSSRIKAAFNWNRGHPGWLTYSKTRIGPKSGSQS